jgi:hypothetical protein
MQMPELLVDFITSLDGYASAEGWPGWWGLEGPEYLAWLGEAGLVDRFRVVMFPVITGATGSERIYDGYPDVALDMTDSRTFDGRIQLVEYVPRVLDGPPSMT